ncbi:peptide deformylase [Pseudenhygromyxa sp. WMMC2535]|uniref:peptide deformylase n=1 Tax=Pseudenhygromyxa sp. WMMC2535 TaxID=2712867 RepID=UPI0015568A19|nr:peptide deformylase [Pseudenhygromyxa sp. WMMC2535]NVB38998.1 peptide deformylase [Pseudenhygromyxa sp. WMMC2535]
MAVLEVVKYPDPRLREDTFEVAEITDDIRQLVRDLTDTMYALNAAGIAAIQVGRLERIFLIDGKVAGGDESSDPLVCINPEVVEAGKGTVIAEEGCLSFPDVFVDVKRPRWAKLRATNIEGETFEVDGDGLFGRALQHEHDHLTGKLMIDLVGMVKKEMIKRKMKRWHNEHDGEEQAASAE